MADNNPTQVLAHTPVSTPPQPPAVNKQPTDISTAFLSSLTKAMESEKAGVVQTPAAVPEPTIEDRFGGNLGHVVKTLVKEAKEKAEADKLIVEPTQVIVPPTPAVAAPATTPVVPAVAVPATPPKNPELDKFKLPEIPQPSKAPTPTFFSPLNLDMSGLSEDERAEMDTAIFAEQKHPDRYRGHAQKVLDYIKQHKRIVSEIESTGEDPEDSSKYAAFKKANKPIKSSEWRKLEQERVSYTAAQEAKAEVAKELNELRREIAETKAAPVIERSLNEFRRVVETILPKDDDPLVATISKNFAGVAVQAADQFIRLSNKQIAYDPNNQLHKGVADFIEDQASQFQKSGDPGLKRGNQTFVSRATFNTMPADQRNKHFTFTDDDVLRILAVNAQQNAEQTIKMERKRLEDAGYTRAPKQAAAPAAPTPAQVVLDPSPRSSASIAPAEPSVTRKETDPFKSFLFAKTNTA